MEERVEKTEEQMEDKIITCRDCGVEFAFTVGEQMFYAERGLAHEPVRCKDCRAKKKAARANG